MMMMMMMMMTTMIFFSLMCYKQVLVSLRRTPGPKVAGVKHFSVGNRLMVSAALAARGAVGACGSGWLTCTSSVGWSGDRHQGGWSEVRHQVVSGPEAGVIGVLVAG